MFSNVFNQDCYISIFSAADKEVSLAINNVLKFTIVASRQPDWKQLCMLPENSISVFKSNSDLTLAKNRLLELARLEKSTLFVESEEFIVNVVNHFKLFSSFVNQLAASNFNVSFLLYYYHINIIN